MNNSADKTTHKALAIPSDNGPISFWAFAMLMWQGSEGLYRPTKSGPGSEHHGAGMSRTTGCHHNKVACAGEGMRG